MTVHKHSYASLSLSQQGGPHRRKTSFRPEPTPPEVHRVGFAPVIVAAGAEPVVAAAPVNGRMVIIVGEDRQVIVDAGVDAAALSRVLQVLERR